MSAESSFLAVDWALIPEKPVFDLAIEINSTFTNFGEQIVLDNDRRPHITVMMGIVQQGKVEQLKTDLLDIPVPESLQLSGRVKVEGESKVHQYLEVGVKELYDYHMLCWEIFKEYHVQESPAFAEDVGESTRTYVCNFFNFAGDAYWPHITLGYGDCRTSVLPRSFKANPGMFHLGDHCTCVKRL